MAGAPVRQPSRGPVVLEPIVLPPEAVRLEPPPPPPPAAQAAPRRGPPLRPLLQRPDQDGDASARWWAAESDEEDDDAWMDLARSLPSVLQHGSPDCLPMDHTLPHLLRQVAGTEDLPSVRSIKLRVIGREMSLQRLCVYVPNLVELNLDGSSVGSLRELGCGLSGLRVLRVTRCGLDSLDGTFGLSALAELYAAYNRVQDIGYLACLPNIEHIDLRGNRVSDIRYAGFLSVCPFLRELVLAENPCAARFGYRATIREMLPGLANLDGVALCSYQQDDDTDTFTEAGEEDEVEADDAREEVRSLEADEQSPKESNHLDEEDEDNCKRSETPSETDDSISTSSASSRGRSDDGSQLRARIPVPRKHTVERTPVFGCGEPRDHRARPLLMPRPATTSCSTPRPRRPQPRSQESKAFMDRPSSASAAPASGADICHADTTGDTDAPSPLTSGGVVCGNLSLALRKARRRKEAWGTASVQAEQARRGSSSSSCSSLSSSWSASDSTPMEGLDGASATLDPVPTSPPRQFDNKSLLAASRRWRNAYHQYRTCNKLKWEQEEASRNQVEDATSTSQETSPT